ncbi:MAG: hypothetical protein IT522_00845 [Burkholderiales bacterium]|nr:hypothetical protein [Burkholderiales bacterium]
MREVNIMSLDAARRLLADGRAQGALEILGRDESATGERLFLTAVCEAQLGRIARARVVLDAAFQATPNAPWNWELMRVNLARDAGDLQYAAAVGSALLQTTPRPETLNAHGLTLEMLDDPRAGEHFVDALRMRPDYVPARLNLARWQHSKGAISDALQTLTDGVDAGVGFPDIHLALARLLEQTGDVATARNAFETALRGGGGNRLGSGRAMADFFSASKISSRRLPPLNRQSRSIPPTSRLGSRSAMPISTSARPRRRRGASSERST